MRRPMAPMAAAIAAASVLAARAVSAELGHAGRWVTDANGRVVIVHGVNMPSKLLPAYPSALGFGDDDAALLERLGFNAVRITVERYAVEPHAGVFDDIYVGHIGETVRLLAGRGILTLLDFHQDDYGPVFFDNGYPDWMTITDGLPPVFEPFPLQYLASPAQNRAFDHLWANDVGPSGNPLQTDDGAILAHVAAALKNEPGLLGYEIINEPWPGSVYPSCVLPAIGCPVFDKGPFSDYYKRLVAAVRSADAAHVIWYEPLAPFNQGVPTSVVPPADPNLGFAFHDYNLCVAGDPKLPAGPGRPCQPEDAMVLSNAIEHSASTGNPLLLTEFGATMDAPTIADKVDQYDRSMMPWMFWSYTRYMVRLAADGTLLPATDANLNPPIVDVLTRPYPKLVSGTPISWSFDPGSRVFAMRYAAARADGSGAFPAGSETEIAVPALSYPGGYGVEIDGGTVLSAPGATVLRVAACAGVSVVGVTILAGAERRVSC